LEYHTSMSLYSGFGKLTSQDGIRAHFTPGAAISNAPIGRVRKVILCGVALPRRTKSPKEKVFA
ncbi:MAG: hypothetical protein RBT75_07945, partial [Anaerolineae bacterium]|nr:hypothetical protein [Anaerolineae bacterium]